MNVRKVIKRKNKTAILVMKKLLVSVKLLQIFCTTQSDIFSFRHAKWKHDMLFKCFTWQYVLNTIHVLSTFIYFANFCQIEKIWRLFVCTSKKPSFLAMLRHNIYDKIATQIFCEFERCGLQLNQFPFHLIYILSMFSWYTNSTIFVVTKCVNSIFVLPIHNFSHEFTFLAL